MAEGEGFEAQGKATAVGGSDAQCLEPEGWGKRQEKQKISRAWEISLQLSPCGWGRGSRVGTNTNGPPHARLQQAMPHSTTNHQHAALETHAAAFETRPMPPSFQQYCEGSGTPHRSKQATN
jgi:hypothetical protein